MPLQLFNAGPYPLRLPPYLSICQLMLIRLSRTPDRTYGDEDLQSKYINDDGGPSLWWRDARVRALQDRLGAVHVSQGIQQEVLTLMRGQSTAVLDRFQTFMDGRKVSQVENRDDILETFAAKENRRRLLDRVAMASPAIVLGFVAVPFVGWPWLIGLGLLTVASAVLAFLAYSRHDEGYFGRSELRAAVDHPSPSS
jgi:hypothetical protein